MWHLVALTLKFMFSKKAMKIEEIFTVDLTVCSKCQIDGEDFIKFCGLLRKHELYESHHPLFSHALEAIKKLVSTSKLEEQPAWHKSEQTSKCG